MRINLRVSYLDGSGVDTTASAPDLIRFEREFERNAARDDLRYTDLAFLAYSSLHRQGKTALDFDAWANTIEEVAGRPGEAEIVPLETTASTGS